MNFRKHITKNKTLILAGTSDSNNEELVSQVKPDELVFHTKSPGSPFVNIKGKPKKGDIKEAAIMCARYSQDWRDNKKNVIVHKFRGDDIKKEKDMKIGTFGVKSIKKLEVLKEDIIKWKKSDMSKLENKELLKTL
jgi:predicted ribosome quality control (RQC) complex YloA/Tae2 family protein